MRRSDRSIGWAENEASASEHVQTWYELREAGNRTAVAPGPSVAAPPVSWADSPYPSTAATFCQSCLGSASAWSGEKGKREGEEGEREVRWERSDHWESEAPHFSPLNEDRFRTKLITRSGSSTMRWRASRSPLGLEHWGASFISFWSQ